MWTIIRRMIRDRRVALACYCVGSILMTLLYVATFPSLKDQAAAFSEMAKSLPKALVEAFGLQNFDLNNFDYLLASKHFSLVWPMLAIFFAGSLAGRSLSGGIETGAGGLELSQPISRTKQFAAKYLGGAILLSIFVLVTVLATPLYSAPFGVTAHFENYVRITWVGWLFTMAVYSLAMMVSAMVAERSRAYAPVAGILIAMYAAWLIGALKDSLKWVKNLSYFNFFDVNKILQHTDSTSQSLLIFGASILVFTLVGWWWWNRRDISV